MVPQKYSNKLVNAVVCFFINSLDDELVQVIRLSFNFCNTSSSNKYLNYNMEQYDIARWELQVESG